jgi:hypothetical protein
MTSDFDPERTSSPVIGRRLLTRIGMGQREVAKLKRTLR